MRWSKTEGASILVALSKISCMQLLAGRSHHGIAQDQVSAPAYFLLKSCLLLLAAAAAEWRSMEARFWMLAPAPAGAAEAQLHGCHGQQAPPRLPDSLDVVPRAAQEVQEELAAAPAEPSRPRSLATVSALVAARTRHSLCAGVHCESH